MRLLASALAVVAGLAANAGAEEALAAETVDRLKEATPLLGFTAGGQRRFATAWVVSQSGTRAIAISSGLVRPDPDTSTVLVFRAGTSSPREMTATLLARDPEAGLSAWGLPGEGAPMPIPCAKADPPTETQVVYYLGYPLAGEQESGRPSFPVNIGRGSVTALRKDAEGRLLAIQLDADLSPGGEGGPVVDTRGELIAVAGGKVAGTRTCMAIPAGAVVRFLAGYACAPAILPEKLTSRSLSADVAVRIVDPLSNCRRVRVLASRKSKNSTATRNESGWNLIDSPDTQVELKLGGMEAKGQLRLEAAGTTDEIWIVQVAFDDRDGSSRATQPVEFLAEFSRAPEGSTEKDPPVDDWVGKAPPIAQRGKIPGIKSTRSELSAVEGVRMVDGARLSQLRVTSPAAGRFCWSATGDAVLLMDGNGVLRRISLPTLLEESKLDCAAPVTTMGTSREGLILLVPSKDEIWVVDPLSLAVTGSWTLPAVDRLAASPALSRVVAGNQRCLQVLNLASGHLSPEILASDFARREAPAVAVPEGSAPIGSFDGLAFSEDGASLIALSDEIIHRFAVSDNSMTYLEAGIRPKERVRSFAVSPGGKYMATLPGCDIFRSGDLGRVTIRLESTVSSLAFDPVLKRIYGAQGGTLQAYDGSGKLQNTWRVFESGQEIRGILAHPAGGKVLVLTDKQLFMIEVPR